MKRTTLITGATSGLGLSHAIYLKSKGYDVIGVARSAKDADILESQFLRDNSSYRIRDGKVERRKLLVPQELLSDLDSLIDAIVFEKCDITDPVSITELFSKLESDWDHLDFLINNAGYGLFGSAIQMDLVKERRQFEVNVLAQLQVIRNSLPFLLKSHSPKIINTASLAAYFGIPFQAHYSASKAALHNLTESLRLELNPLGIQVCSIDPGDINTSFNTASVTETLGREVDMLDIRSLEDSMEFLDFPEYLSEEQKHILRKKEIEVWRHIVRNLILAPPPLVVSRKLEKLLRKKKLKPHYKVGSMFQVLAISVAQRLFSANLSNYLMGKFYGL
ncbi:MAG: SDR family NAD(P)-dependent oxidoreductase [Methanobacteriota archaeon]|nr:MAG: SDR family NAD(P)-dependent oxidoreductase [Euryarchaeota archaeon]